MALLLNHSDYLLPPCEEEESKCHVDCLGSAVVAKLVEIILRKEVIEGHCVLLQLAKGVLTVFIRSELIDLWIDPTSYRCILLSDYCHIIM